MKEKSDKIFRYFPVNIKIMQVCYLIIGERGGDKEDVPGFRRSNKTLYFLGERV